MVQSLPLAGSVCTGLVACYPTQQRITRRNLGMLVSIPPGALPKGRSIRIAVHCCQGSPFSLPAGLLLVSPVYLIIASSQASFLKPLLLAMKHSVKVVSDVIRSQLTFVMASLSSTDESPSAASASKLLSAIRDGQFKINSSTGRISVDRIHQLAIAIAYRRPGTES